jgi:hypothetical protein
MAFTFISRAPQLLHNQQSVGLWQLAQFPQRSMQNIVGRVIITRDSTGFQHFGDRSFVHVFQCLENPVERGQEFWFLQIIHRLENYFNAKTSVIAGMQGNRPKVL